MKQYVVRRATGEFLYGGGEFTPLPASDPELFEIASVAPDVPVDPRVHLWNGVAVADKSPEIITAQDAADAWVALRTERDAMLAASDWTDLPNAPLTAEQQAVWQTYRQALRDLPAHTDDPDQVTWPTPPA